MWKLEDLYFSSSGVNWYNHFGKSFGTFRKVKYRVAVRPEYTFERTENIIYTQKPVQ